MNTQNVDATVEAIHFGPARGTDGASREFELHIAGPELRSGGQRIELRPQSVQLLAILLRRSGRLVTLEELRHELWGEQRLAWRNSLHQCVRDLRRALDDDAHAPRFVATVARVGYRFVGELASPVSPELEAPSGWRRVWHALHRPLRRPSLAFVAGFAVAALIPFSWLLVCTILAD